MQTLKSLDQNYLKSIHNTFEELKKAHASISNNYKCDLSKTEITQSILERLKAYYQTQNSIKSFLDKSYIAPGADFFVETVLFFVNIYLAQKNAKLIAYSEKQIKKQRNAIRPDISIWKRNCDEIVAIIECKTQLGWNRNGWETQYNKRTKELQDKFPNAKSFLLVMTGSNWSGFRKNDKRLNSSFFCLLDNISPTDYNMQSQILTPIENLLKLL